GANLSIATTGIAGPGGGVAGKPVGTVWLASVVNHQLASTCQHFSGTRDEVRQATVAFALNWLINRIDSDG
ncbi:MAG: CinA family protein, partial [Idiomarina sp.]|nr:CinA family protein [Idiomarina sp.]